MKRSRMHEHAIYAAAPSEMAATLCGMIVAMEEGYTSGAVVLARTLVHMLNVAPPDDHVLDRLIVVAVQFRGARGRFAHDPWMPCPVCRRKGTTPTGRCVQCGHQRFTPVAAIDRQSRGA